MDDKEFDKLTQALKEDRQEHPEDYQIKNESHIMISTLYEAFLLSHNEYWEENKSKLDLVSPIIETVKGKLANPDKKEVDDLIKAIKNIESGLKDIGWNGYTTEYIPTLPQKTIKYPNEAFTEDITNRITEAIPETVAEGNNGKLIINPKWNNRGSTVRVDLRGISYLYWIIEGKPADIRTFYFKKIEELEAISKHDPASIIILENQIQQEYIKIYDNQIREIDNIIKKINDIINEGIKNSGKEQNKEYYKQNEASNALQAINSKDKRKAREQETTTKCISKNGFELQFKNTDMLNSFDSFTRKFLIYGDTNLTNINDNKQNDQINDNIVFSLSEFAERLGLKNIEDVKDRLQKTIKLLRTSIEYKCIDPKSKKWSGWGITSIILSGEIDSKNDLVKIQYDRNYIKAIIKEGHLTTYPPQIFKLDDEKNPESFSLFLKINNHQRMNGKKPNKNIIAVKTLIDITVSKNDRNYKKRIIEPFERDLNALNEFFKWEYSYKGEKIENPSFSLFKELNIKVINNE